MPPFVAWEFRRSGPGAPGDANTQAHFAADAGEGTATILPANFALVGVGTPVDWQNVEFDAADVNLYLGDFNGDGSVNHYDLALWIPQNAPSPQAATFDPRFDLTADALVDAADLAVLMPRLYQPVMDTAPASPAGVMAEVGQCTSPRWNAGGEHDLDWVDSLPSLRHQARHARQRIAATDRAMEGFGSLFSV